MEQMGLNFSNAQTQGKKQDSNEPRVLSVSDLNKQIRGSLEKQFDIIWVQAEISNFKAHTSGHWYFSLKDAKAQVNGVMFRGHNSRLKFQPENGMEVLIRGKVTVYEPRGNYQVFCESLEPVGAGALQKQFEQLKEKLQKEGLFERSLKKQLPKLPQHIAVVTSPTGAAIRDILNIVGRRFPGLKVTVVPTIVQGASAAPQITKALALAEKIKSVDAIIIGRGGGSMEDLWCFNDEKLARMIASCHKPIISAVGHEIDFTISDFVADYRSPTPSAAAEVVSSNIVDLMERIDSYEHRLVQSIEHSISEHRQSVDHSRRLLVDPQRYLQDLKIRCQKLEERMTSWSRRLTPVTRQFIGEVQSRLKRALPRAFSEKKQKLIGLGNLLDSLSPLKVVDRGYSIVTFKKEVVKSAEQLKAGDLVQMRFSEGEAQAEIQNIKLFEKE